MTTQMIIGGIMFGRDRETAQADVDMITGKMKEDVE